MGSKLAFTPIQIGNVEVPNRIVRSAHDTGISFGTISDDLIAYHEARARGGCGLTILEASSVHPSSDLHVSLYDDAIIPSFERLMAAIRPHGMKVFQQLWHGGAVYPSRSGPPWTVSDVPGPGLFGAVGNPMSLAEIGELQQAFVAAALRCQRGGLDGVEVHAAHGYIFHQFLSPFYNTRTDRYGGSFENRARFLFETVRAVREAVGKDYVVGIRLGASELAGGVDESVNIIILEQLQAEGLIDYVSMTKGDYYRWDTMVGGMHHPTGYEMPSAIEIGAVAKVPRIVAGRFRTIDEAEQVLKDGEAELVSLVRAQIADPDLVRKTRDVGPEAVRPCIGCNQGCIGGLYRTGRMGCTVNPNVGLEATMAESLIMPAADRKKILVVGGGPAGMETARVSALQGHNVVLAEAQPSLGGAINIARKAPFLHGVGDITHWLEQEVYRLGVEVRLGAYMDVDDVLAEGADMVYVATGSMPRMDGVQSANPSIKVTGTEQSHVLSSTDLFVQKHELSGKRALVLDNVGHLEAVASMEHLLRSGASVTYVSNNSTMFAYAMTAWRDGPALERFYALDAEFDVHLRSELHKIDIDTCSIKPIQASSQQMSVVAADLVVLITQNAPMRGLFDELREAGANCRLVGDARSPRDLQVAIAEGHQLARAYA